MRAVSWSCLVRLCLVSDPWDGFTGHFVPLTAKWRGIFFDYFLDPQMRISPVVDRNSESMCDATSIWLR